MSCDVCFYVLDEFIGGVDLAVCEYIFNIIINNYFLIFIVLIFIYLIFDIELILDEIVFFKDGKVVC